LTFTTYACSGFVIKKQDRLFLCANWDWESGDGYIVINNRNTIKKSFLGKSDKELIWTSKYGSITFNQIGRELPYTGMNEAGLSIFSAALSKMDNPPIDNRYSLNESQWIQYLLDNYSSIDEIIKSDSFLSIRMIAVPIHYIICDKSGNTAVIELNAGKLCVYTKEKLPLAVLENSLYESSVLNYHYDISWSRLSSRFSKAAYLLENLTNFPTDNLVKTSFNFLENIRQANYTKWQIVYDLKKGMIYFRTSLNIDFIVARDKFLNHKLINAIDSINFSKIDFNCNNKTRAVEITTRQNKNIYEQFTPFNTLYSKDKVKSIVKQFKNKGLMNDITEKDIDLYSEYIKEDNCEIQ
jgi:choloylglycine hydrolase